MFAVGCRCPPPKFKSSAPSHINCRFQFKYLALNSNSTYIRTSHVSQRVPVVVQVPYRRTVKNKPPPYKTNERTTNEQTQNITQSHNAHNNHNTLRRRQGLLPRTRRARQLWRRGGKVSQWSLLLWLFPECASHLSSPPYLTLRLAATARSRSHAR